MNFASSVLAAAEKVRATAAVPLHAAPPSTARADFDCAHCKTLGRESHFESLPASATRCPMCGYKRGFRRLFDHVGVSIKGHRAAQVIDPPMTRAFDHHSAVKADARAAEQKGIVGRAVPAAAALSSIDAAARVDSRDVLIPTLQSAGFLTGRYNVRPRWQR